MTLLNRNVFLLYVGYACSLMCKSNLDAVFPRILSTLDLSTANGGSLLSMITVAFLSGATFTAPLVDKSPTLTFSALLLIIGVINLLICFWATSYYSLVFLLSLSRFCGGGMFPAMAKSTSQSVSSGNLSRTLSVLSTSSRVGSVAGLLLAGYFFETFQWPWAKAGFLIHGIFAIIIATVCLVFLRPMPINEGGGTDSKLTGVSLGKETTPSSSSSTKQQTTTWLQVISSTTFLWMALAVVCMTPITEFQPLLTMLFMDLGSTAGEAARLASIFPIASFLGVLALGSLADYYHQRKSHIFCSSLLVCALGSALLTLGWVWQSLRVSVVAVFVVGFFVSAPYFVPTTIVALDLGGKQFGASCIATLDTLGYSACALLLPVLLSCAKGSIFQSTSTSTTITDESEVPLWTLVGGILAVLSTVAATAMWFSLFSHRGFATGDRSETDKKKIA